MYVGNYTYTNTHTYMLTHGDVYVAPRLIICPGPTAGCQKPSLSISLRPRNPFNPATPTDSLSLLGNPFNLRHLPCHRYASVS